MGGTELPLLSYKKIIIRQNSTYCTTMTYSAPAKRQLNGLQVQRRHPALGNETLLGHVQVEQVQSVVDGLDLAHLHKPVGDVLGCGGQHLCEQNVRKTKNKISSCN
jgi:hypothetical protein